MVGRCGDGGHAILLTFIKRKKITEGRNTGHYLLSFFNDYKLYEIPVLSNQNKY